jgi:hypothetical protein
LYITKIRSNGDLFKEVIVFLQENVTILTIDTKKGEGK